MPEHDPIRSRLEALLKQGPPARKSKAAAALDPYKDLIAKAVTAGFTYGAITAELKSAGVAVSPESIRRYIVSLNGKPKSKAKKT